MMAANMSSACSSSLQQLHESATIGNQSSSHLRQLLQQNSRTKFIHTEFFKNLEATTTNLLKESQKSNPPKKKRREHQTKQRERERENTAKLTE